MNRLSRGLAFAAITCLLPACTWFPNERVLLDRGGIHIAVESDPSVKRAISPTANSHPARLSTDEVRLLLGPLLVSGWSGTLVGVLEQARPVPVFSSEELDGIAGPIAEGLHTAHGEERIAFQLLGTRKGASDDRIAGSLFLRGRYLHVVLTDHAEFARADTGGGDERDLRDTKGMKLWVARPAVAATVPDAEEPRWAPFETVHLSMVVADVLAAAKTPAEPPATTVGRVVVPGSASSSQAPQTPPSLRKQASPGELSLQIQELTHSNLDLRKRIEDQDNTIQALREELTKLRQELERKPSRQRQPARSSTP